MTYRLLSLLDIMKKFKIDTHWRLAAALNETWTLLLMDEVGSDDDPEILIESTDSVISQLTALDTFCDEYELGTSLALVRSAQAKLSTKSGEIEMLLTAIRTELDQKLFLFVPADRAAFFDKENHLSDNAKNMFPEAAQQLRYAGNSYAAGLDTAVVFYCMRALEHGLKALSDNINVKFDNQNWHNILDQIESAIATLRNARKGPSKNDRLQFLSQAAGEFRHFKDGWRNYVSHNKVEYDQNQAKRIMEHVASFLEVLGIELGEP